MTPLYAEDDFGIIGKSPLILKVYQTVSEIRDSQASVLLLGESGTGKEVIAHAIHQTSDRRHGPFVVINCSAIPEGLMESELFGHLRGAFTGAVQDKRGLFEEADGGTVFLDEIGEIPPSVQVKLLRVLQEREIRRVGGDQNIKINVRVIAATHRNLAEMMKTSTFREDLYYRLSVVNLQLPALRDRTEDIPILCEHFLSRFADRMKKPAKRLSGEVLEVFKNHLWSGNIRELENLIERLCVLSSSELIEKKDLPPLMIAQEPNSDSLISRESFKELSYQDAKQRVMDVFNKAYLSQLILASRGNITVASQQAGMDRSNLKKILKNMRFFQRSPLSHGVGEG